MHTVPYPISKKGSGRVREMNSMFAARMERLAEELRRREADALFVFSSELDNRPGAVPFRVHRLLLPWLWRG